MILRSCVKCGRPSPESYCEAHKPKPWATSTRRQTKTVSGWEESRRRKRILAKYQECCHWCGRKSEAAELEMDHVVPLAEGGPDTEANLAPIHKEPCHRQKTAAEARRATS